MEPNLKSGSFFIASSIPFFFFPPRVNDRIVFKNDNKIVVKRISEIENEKYFILGDNKRDSKNFQPIKRKEILGKVIWIL